MDTNSRHLYARRVQASFNSPVCWTLAITFFAQLVICIDYHERRSRSYLDRLGPHWATTQEGLVISHNGLGYYAWLRSLLVDGDWDFDNEFDEHQIPREYVPPIGYRTTIGRRPNQWSLGPALAWSVTIAPLHLLLSASGCADPKWIPNGYTCAYQVVLGITSLAFGFIGLVSLYCICKHFARPSRAALAASLTWMGTTIVYYASIELSSAHGTATTAVALLVWYWLESYGTFTIRRALLLGVFLGAASLCRWQLSTFYILPCLEAMLHGYRCRSPRIWLWLLFWISAVGASGLIAFSPQMFAWHAVYGCWVLSPVPGIVPNWLTPAFYEVLLSENRSLFYWTPVSLLCCFGFCSLLSREFRTEDQGILHATRREQAWTLFGAFAVQVYVIAALLGKGDFVPAIGNYRGVHLAACYGFRFLTESMVAIAPGLALLFEGRKTTSFRAVSCVACLLAIWNIQLVGQVSREIIPAFTGASPRALIGGTVQLLSADPLLVICLLLAPSAAWSSLIWSLPPKRSFSERQNSLSNGV
jgi:hypothetical protein